MSNLLSSSAFSCDDPFLNSLGDGDWTPIGKIIKDKIGNMDHPFELFHVDYINPLSSKIVKCKKPDQVVIESGNNTYLTDAWTYIFKLYYNDRACLLFYSSGANLILSRKLDGNRCDLKGLEINTINHILDEYGNPRIEIVCNARGLEPYEVSAVKRYFNRTKYSSFYSQIIKSQEAEMTFRNALRSNYGVMPIIKDVYYNAPHTTVKWNDGTSTTVSCYKGEKFNKENGLMAAISRKYFEILGMPYPRSAIKKVVKNAHDQTEKTLARKAYKLAKKQKLLAAAQEEEN